MLEMCKISLMQWKVVVKFPDPDPLLPVAEEIAQGSVDLGYIFESPDGGKTIFKRKVGEEKREQVTKKQWKEYNRNR